METDVDEVLQAHTIFADVGRGVLAQSEDMIDAFGTDDEDVVCIEVLNKGEFQVSEAERAMQLDALFKDVASRVADKCVCVCACVSVRACVRACVCHAQPHFVDTLKAPHAHTDPRPPPLTRARRCAHSVAPPPR